MKGLSKYVSLKQSFLYVEDTAFPFVNVRLYSNRNGRFDRRSGITYESIFTADSQDIVEHTDLTDDEFYQQWELVD